MKISGSQRHNFVCSDTGTNKLVFIDCDGNITKEMTQLCDYSFQSPRELSQFLFDSP